MSGGYKPLGKGEDLQNLGSPSGDGEQPQVPIEGDVSDIDPEKDKKHQDSQDMEKRRFRKGENMASPRDLVKPEDSNPELGYIDPNEHLNQPRKPKTQ